jgi:hydroxymethylpyrimidine pyrophosphatase-like HAD family hydrolase
MPDALREMPQPRLPPLSLDPVPELARLLLRCPTAGAMKFSVLAIDFDGTIAFHDRLDPSVRQAIAELRAQGITVILVTGRLLVDLRRVAGDLHFADAVVAENGAVIEFPDSGYARVLGAAPPPALLNALREDGLDVHAGQVIVDAHASDAMAILGAIRRLELPYALAFNRSRVMVVPQAISKATACAKPWP